MGSQIGPVTALVLGIGGCGICYDARARCIGLTERVRPYRNAEGASFRPETLRQQDGRPSIRCLRTGVSSGLWRVVPHNCGLPTEGERRETGA
jgi:hypothetical protein